MIRNRNVSGVHIFRVRGLNKIDALDYRNREIDRYLTTKNESLISHYLHPHCHFDFHVKYLVKRISYG